MLILFSTVLKSNVTPFKLVETATSSTDPGVLNTVGRLFDVTYRFNLGMVNFTAQKAKDLTDRKNWVSVICIKRYHRYIIRYTAIIISVTVIQINIENLLFYIKGKFLCCSSTTPYTGQGTNSPINHIPSDHERIKT